MGDHLDPTPELDPKVVAQFADSLHAELAKHRVEVRDRYWEGKTLPVDGYRFVNCRFDRCVFEFTWPNFEFEGCVFEGCDFRPHRQAADADPTPGLNKK